MRPGAPIVKTGGKKCEMRRKYKVFQLKKRGKNNGKNCPTLGFGFKRCFQLTAVCVQQEVLARDFLIMMKLETEGMTTTTTSLNGLKNDDKRAAVLREQSTVFCSL